MCYLLTLLQLLLLSHLYMHTKAIIRQADETTSCDERYNYDDPDFDARLL